MFTAVIKIQAQALFRLSSLDSPTADHNSSNNAINVQPPPALIARRTVLRKPGWARSTWQQVEEYYLQKNPWLQVTKPPTRVGLVNDCSPDPASTYPRFKVFASSQTSLRDLMHDDPPSFRIRNEGVEIGALNLVMIDIRAFSRHHNYST